MDGPSDRGEWGRDDIVDLLLGRAANDQRGPTSLPDIEDEKEGMTYWRE